MIAEWSSPRVYANVCRGSVGAAAEERNSASQALTRLAHCVLMADVGLPHASIREAVGLAIHLVVHINRQHGRRVVSEAVRVCGYNLETGCFELAPVLSSPQPEELTHG